MKKRIVFLSVVSLSLFSGCHHYGGGVRVETSHQAGNMPPAHAPAYGRRAQHHYYYYPNAEFYFDTGRGLYFYLDSYGRWAVSATLPAHLLKYRHSHYVEFEMESDKPYLHHHQHKQKYKNQAKKNV